MLGRESQAECDPDPVVGLRVHVLSTLVPSRLCRVENRHIEQKSPGRECSVERYHIDADRSWRVDAGPYVLDADGGGQGHAQDREHGTTWQAPGLRDPHSYWPSTSSNTSPAAPEGGRVPMAVASVIATSTV